MTIFTRFTRLEAWERYRIGRVGTLAMLLGLTGSAAVTPVPAANTYGRLPTSFELNRGQTAPEVHFLARGPGFQLFLTLDEAVLVLRQPASKVEVRKAMAPVHPSKTDGGVVRMHLEGINPSTLILGQAPLPGKVNYLRGQDPRQWRTDIPTYGKVKYANVYPGIDLVYYGWERQLEYDFIVAPGANPQDIELTFSGGALQLSDTGDLVLATGTGRICFKKPVIYQEIAGRKQPIEGEYVRRGVGRIGFRIGAYDTARPLIIDPVLGYSTYLGGQNWDFGNAIAVDSQGQAYVVGETASADFPNQNAWQPATGGGDGDAFVAKFNAAGNALLYATYLGGSKWESGNAIAVDSRGHAYVTGRTFSTDFPTTPQAPQPALASALNNDGDIPPDAFVVKLNAAGNELVYATYLGGSAYDSSTGIAVDSRGQSYVTGYTRSADFPTTPQILQPIHGAGFDAFVAKLNAAGSALVYSTYLGGGNDDWGAGVAVDSRAQAYIVGSTQGGFPLKDALQPALGGSGDAFVAKLNAAGSALVYSTFLDGVVTRCKR